MSNALTIGEINCVQKPCKGLNGECKLRSFDSTVPKLQAVTSTNYELLSTVINGFKDSTETSQLSKSFNSYVASNESAISTLVENVGTSETIYGTPAVQDFPKIGSCNVESTTLTNVMLSSSPSKLRNEIIVSQAPFDEITCYPLNKDERENNATVIEERSGTASFADQKSGSSDVVGNRSGSADVVGNIIGTADVVGNKSGTVDFVDNRNGTPNHSIGKNRYEINEKFINVRKIINKNCPDTKSKQSSKLNPNGNIINKTNSQRSSELEFIEAINLVNSDMVKKSRKLLLKQTLVSEILSYVQATQSVCRFLVPRNISADDISRNKTQNFYFNSNNNFHSAGECILEELQLYLNDLKADYKDWEDKRITILHISERIPSQFELCKSENSTQILMHNISTGICNILQDMNDITSRRENRNLEFAEIGDSIDSYIRFSSSFIIDKYPSN